jgi:hypothetical protein
MPRGNRGRIGRRADRARAAGGAIGRRQRAAGTRSACTRHCRGACGAQQRVAARRRAQHACLRQRAPQQCNACAGRGAPAASRCQISARQSLTACDSLFMPLALQSRVRRCTRLRSTRGGAEFPRARAAAPSVIGISDAMRSALPLPVRR